MSTAEMSAYRGSRAARMFRHGKLPEVSSRIQRLKSKADMVVIPMVCVTGDLLQNPVLSPTAKLLQSSLNEMERTTVAVGLSSGVRVFILMVVGDGLR
jgi:hypothetical protein